MAPAPQLCHHPHSLAPAAHLSETPVAVAVELCQNPSLDSGNLTRGHHVQVTVHHVHHCQNPNQSEGLKLMVYLVAQVLQSIIFNLSHHCPHNT